MSLIPKHEREYCGLCHKGVLLSEKVCPCFSKMPSVDKLIAHADVMDTLLAERDALIQEMSNAIISAFNTDWADDFESELRPIYDKIQAIKAKENEVNK